MNKTRFMRSEKGQSLVLIAFMMVVLLALAGLAIDGGNMFLQRRRVQNAADSGSLAGTRVLAQHISHCRPGDAADDDVVDQAVHEFVGGNGFPAAEGNEIVAWYTNAAAEPLGQVGAGGIPATATGVHVRIDAQVPTHFLKVLGIDNSQIGADALAMTGRVTQFGGGLLPFGVPLQVIQALGPDEDFVALDSGDGSFCIDENGNGQYDDGEECLNPGDNSAQRGWLNLNYIYNVDYWRESSPLYRTFLTNADVSGCKDPPKRPGLAGYATGDCPYEYPIIAGPVGRGEGDFIHGLSGASTAGMKEIWNNYNGQIGYVPIFDSIYRVSALESSPDYPQPEGINWPSSGGGTNNALMYHVVGFAIMRINDPARNDGELAGEFIEAIIGDGVIQPGAGIGGVCQETPALFGVNLWE